ncbi:MAG: hypothetical protein IKG65_01320 [Exiguobacterium sp.]|uniref:MFS transporter n=1 Tax=Exiguobacterium sp. (strain ATCC BAA-1283 / AT1b) TaxID=360911 RepID=C4L1V9_EXISA|nr:MULTISPECIES: hypothetical protein [unclassified Exiguobacterium]ACQ69133.1 hypothetical protein EAT1b_0200 [Exiguobacterium sp. AT1b]MBQ6459272.1 hypothetical protein [Exiguobacterium sp.]MBR3061066.1 hypothetical protein [Exiguobacterium sp.]MBR3216282.1 hypothetical protein [Exiguobacterium sp.]MCV9899219.1 hypothetical protein [Exiguobacterium sp. N5]
MWIIFGLAAIGATLINLTVFMMEKDYKLPMAIALSLVALTLCAEYSLLNMWVEAKDWAAIMDVVPGMSRALWFLTIAAIFMNILPIFLERKRNKMKESK